jgi:hypothetical protein
MIPVPYVFVVLIVDDVLENSELLVHKDALKMRKLVIPDAHRFHHYVHLSGTASDFTLHAMRVTESYANQGETIGKSGAMVEERVYSYQLVCHMGLGIHLLPEEHLKIVDLVFFVTIREMLNMLFEFPGHELSTYMN